MPKLTWRNDPVGRAFKWGCAILLIAFAFALGTLIGIGALAASGMLQ